MSIFPNQNLSQFFRVRLDVGFAIVVLAAAWFLDLPVTDFDDMVTMDAPVSIARTGRLEAPWLKDMLAPFGTTSYYLQIPYFAWSLGGWLKLVGVSHLAVKAFFFSLYTASALILALLLARMQVATAFKIAIHWLTINYLLSWHIRAEPMAWFLFLSSLAWGLDRHGVRNSARLASALFLAIAAALMAPNLLPLAFLAVALLWKNWVGERYDKDDGRILFLTLLFGGLVVNAILLYVAIGGEVLRFRNQFLEHAAIRNMPFDVAGAYVRLTYGWNGWLVFPWILVALTIMVIALLRATPHDDHHKIMRMRTIGFLASR